MRNLNGEEICASVPDNAFNVWNDDFIQSMTTPYGITDYESEYRERAETLVKEVKMILREMQSRSGDGDSLMEGLEMVDALQCLGIGRYFEDEIKLFLDSAYRCWDTNVGIKLGSERSSSNLNATALGLRLLRLRRYDVSADVLQSFMDKNGRFFYSVQSNDNNNINCTEECDVMRGMLNLLRPSSMAFPGERVMEEAKIFTSARLKSILQTSGDASFLKEVEYALTYEFSRTFTRWEARSFIEIYELDDRRLKHKKILELAKLDFNILQYTYKMEMKNLSKTYLERRFHPKDIPQPI